MNNLNSLLLDNEKKKIDILYFLCVQKVLIYIVQSLCFKEKIDRENEDDKIMKIFDSNDKTEVDKFLKEQTNHIYSSKYSKKIRNKYNYKIKLSQKN